MVMWHKICHRGVPSCNYPCRTCNYSVSHILNKTHVFTLFNPLHFTKPMIVMQFYSLYWVYWVSTLEYLLHSISWGKPQIGSKYNVMTHTAASPISFIWFSNLSLLLCFLTIFWKLVMWWFSQWPITWTLIGVITLTLFFLAFWSNQMSFAFGDFGVYAEDPDMDLENSASQCIQYMYHFHPKGMK